MPWKPATTGTSPSREGRAQRPRQDATDLRAEVRGRGPDAGLGAGEGAGRDAARLEAEGEERGREGLAGGERPIGLARQPGVRMPAPGSRSESPCVGQQDARGAQDRIGDALEGADHDHRAQPGRSLARDDVDGGGDVLRAAQDRSAELVDDDLRG